MPIVTAPGSPHYGVARRTQCDASRHHGCPPSLAGATPSGAETTGTGPASPQDRETLHRPRHSMPAGIDRRLIAALSMALGMVEGCAHDECEIGSDHCDDLRAALCRSRLRR